MEDIQTSLEETLLSSERVKHHEDPDPQNAGGVGSMEADGAEEESYAEGSDQDPWRISSDYVVRVHKLPRTILLSPLDVPDDLPPIDVKNIEVLMTTKPLFAGQQWPEMSTLR